MTTAPGSDTRATPVPELSDPNITLANERYVAEALARRRRRLRTEAQTAGQGAGTVTRRARLTLDECETLAGAAVELARQYREPIELRRQLVELFEEPVEVEVEVRRTLRDRVLGFVVRLCGSRA